VSEVASSITTAETKGTSSAKTATNWPQCGTNGLLSPENGDHETAGDRQTSNSTFDSTSTAPPLPRGSLVASKLPTRRAVLMRNHSSTFTVADIAKKFDEIVAPSTSAATLLGSVKKFPSFAMRSVLKKARFLSENHSHFD
jgi:hypothetical protein